MSLINNNLPWLLHPQLVECMLLHVAIRLLERQPIRFECLQKFFYFAIRYCIDVTRDFENVRLQATLRQHLEYSY